MPLSRIGTLEVSAFNPGFLVGTIRESPHATREVAGPVDVVGHRQGGLAALAFALMRPSSRRQPG